MRRLVDLAGRLRAGEADAPIQAAGPAVPGRRPTDPVRDALPRVGDAGVEDRVPVEVPDELEVGPGVLAELHEEAVVGAGPAEATQPRPGVPAAEDGEAGQGGARPLRLAERLVAQRRPGDELLVPPRARGPAELQAEAVAGAAVEAPHAPEALVVGAADGRGILATGQLHQRVDGLVPVLALPWRGGATSSAALAPARDNTLPPDSTREDHMAGRGSR